jgi:MoxR-like ATPase
MPIEDVRRLTRHTNTIDLTIVRPAYLQLIRRLREAGMPLSDRRAVRLQRVVAASAVLCGRPHADVSDLWVMRYIWETPAQAEMLAAHVAAVSEQFASDLKAPESQRHPLSDAIAGADPQQLAEAIEAIADRADHPAAADQLSLLAARIEWVTEEAARDHLRIKINEAREKMPAR